METVKHMWQSYVRMVMPPGVGPGSVQYQETRRAFYAGCWGMLQAARQVGEDAVSEDEACAYLEAREAELKAFYANVKAGKA